MKKIIGAIILVIFFLGMAIFADKINGNQVPVDTPMSNVFTVE